MRKMVALWLLVFMIGCGSRPAPVEDVQKAAQLFFNRLNEAQYTKIYDDGAKRLKEVEREKVIDELKKITAGGRIQKHFEISKALPQESDERRAEPVYGVMTEQVRGELTLVFVDEAGEWKLANFIYKTRP